MVETEWCNGLPLKARRALTESERTALTAERSCWRRRAATILGVYAALFVLLVICAMHAAPDPSRQQTSLGICSTLMVGGLALVILGMRDSLRRADAIRGDLRENVVLIYGDEHISAEIMSLSRRVWSIKRSDEPEVQSGSREWTIAPKAAYTAEAPVVASIASQWLSHVQGENGISTGRRELSSPETAEIQRFARQLWRRPLLPAIGLSAWSLIILSLIAAGNRTDSRWGYFQTVMLFIFTAIADWKLFRTALFSLRLRRDTRDGRVLIVRSEETGAASDSGKTLFQTVEILPVSRCVWSIDGHPARWRTVSTAADVF